MKDWSYESAADLNVGPIDRFRSVKREKGLLSSLAHFGTIAGLKTYLKLYHRAKVVGKERLPTKPPFVVISNHASHLDALILAAALPPIARINTYAVAAGDVFFTTISTSIATSLFINALPLWRKKIATHAMEDLKERLLAGHTGLILFPEGARTRDGKPLPFKPGLGMLVAGTNIPVYPCFLDGAFEALKPDSAIPRPVRITVRVGEPITFESLPNSREGWNGVARSLRNAVAAASQGAWAPLPEAT